MRSALRPATAWNVFLVALIAILVFAGTRVSEAFLEPANLGLTLNSVMAVAIMAVGMMPIILTGDIDLSVASMLGLASCVFAKFVLLEAPLVFALVITLLVGLLGGLLNGLLVVRIGVPALVVTLGTLALFRGVGYVVLGGDSVSSFPTVVSDFGFNNVPGTPVPWPVLTFVLVALVAGAILRFTVLGRRVYAIGGNALAANFSGISVTRVRIGLFAFSGSMAALAGLVYTAQLSNANAANGLGLELQVIVVIVFAGVRISGGKGSMLGVGLSVIAFALLTSVLTLAGVEGNQQKIILGLLLVAPIIAGNVATRVRESRQSAAARSKDQSFRAPTIPFESAVDGLSVGATGERPISGAPIERN